MIGAFLIKFTEFQKTGPLGKLFIPLGKNEKKNLFSKLEVDQVFRVAYLPFNK